MMDTQSVVCVLTILVCVTQCIHAGCTTAEGGCNKVLRKLPSTVRVAPIDLQKPENVRYEVCADVGGTIYYCPGDEICCTPGSPTSKCCPADHPLCVGEYCCVEGYPKICGDYCCTSASYCCNDENCCASENQCCGTDQCCQEQSPCCTGPDEKTCCNNETMACCGSQYGCVSPCECPFDAIGCDLATVKDRDRYLNYMTVDCPLSPFTALYRVLRTDESCDNGLIAKNPLAEKTVLSHVNCGSRPNYRSQYISFSSSVEVANDWKQRSGLDLQIATVKPEDFEECVMYDLTTAENRELYLGNAVCKNFAKASCEVLLSCGDKRVQCSINNDTSKPTARDASQL